MAESKELPEAIEALSLDAKSNQAATPRVEAEASGSGTKSSSSSDNAPIPAPKFPEESEENQSYVRGYNDALKDMPREAGTPVEAEASDSVTDSALFNESVLAPASIAVECEENQLYVGGYNDAIRDMKLQHRRRRDGRCRDGCSCLGHREPDESVSEDDNSSVSSLDSHEDKYPRLLSEQMRKQNKEHRRRMRTLYTEYAKLGESEERRAERRSVAAAERQQAREHRARARDLEAEIRKKVRENRAGARRQRQNPFFLQNPFLNPLARDILGDFFPFSERIQRSQRRRRPAGQHSEAGSTRQPREPRFPSGGIDSSRDDLRWIDFEGVDHWFGAAPEATREPLGQQRWPSEYDLQPQQPATHTDFARFFSPDGRTFVEGWYNPCPT